MTPINGAGCLKVTERNIDELFDRMEILEAMYRYCSAADRNEPEGMIEIFVPDAVIDYIPDQPSIHGTAALSEMLHAFLGNVVSGSHYITNPLFNFKSPDEALLGCYMYSWQRFKGYPGEADVHRWGRYELRWVRTDDGWKINYLRLLSAGEYGGTRIAEQIGRTPVPTIDHE